MKLKKQKKMVSENGKPTTKQEKNMQMGIYSATAVEHTYYKAGGRDCSLGSAQKLAVLQMMRDGKS